MELIINDKKNKAYYLLPLTQIAIKDELLTHLVNVYFADKHNKKHTKHLFILFSLKEISEEDLLLWCEKSPMFEDSYLYSNYLMCVFEYLDKWSEDVELYKQGKYSKTSRLFQETILQTLFGSDYKNTNLFHYFQPSLKKRKEFAEFLYVEDIPEELWSKPNLEVEEFSISNYIEVIR